MSLTYAQQSFNRNRISLAPTYDKQTDTLLVVLGKVLDSDRIQMDRKQFANCDTLMVNVKGITIEKFTVSAIGLGQNVEVENVGAVIGDDVRNVVINKNPNYKFIYLKNILLRTLDGKACEPTSKSIKVVFIN